MYNKNEVAVKIKISFSQLFAFFQNLTMLKLMGREGERLKEDIIYYFVLV